MHKIFHIYSAHIVFVYVHLYIFYVIYVCATVQK